MPTRLSILVLLGISMLLAMAVQTLRSHVRWPRAVTVAIGLLLVAELAPGQRPLYSAAIPTVYQTIAKDPRPVRVLNLLGQPAEDAARAAVPDAEILSYPANDIPDDVRAEAMFSVWQPAPIHERLDEVGVQWMHIPGTGVDGWPRELLAGRTVTCARGVSAVPTFSSTTPPSSPRASAP